MDVKTSYKQQIDMFCDENNKLMALELLRMAEERKANPEACEKEAKVIDFPIQRKTGRTWKKYLSVACIVIVCSLAVATTALAAIGVLQDIFRKIFKDETSAWLVEQGLYYEANQSGEDNGFKIDFIGVTGDKSVSKMFFDVYVEDDELADDYDEIGLYVSAFGKESAEGEESEFGLPVALGEKDAENENLYHVTLVGGMVRMPSGQPMRLVVEQVVFNPKQFDLVLYDVNIEFTMDVPSTALHSALMMYYEGRPFTYDGYTYYLNYATYGVYHTELNIVFDYDGESLEGHYDSTYRLEELLQSRWREFISQVRLVVDGVEYQVNDSDDGYAYIWYDKEGEAGYPGRCYVNPQFPSIDYTTAKKINIKMGDTSYILK